MQIARANLGHAINAEVMIALKVARKRTGEKNKTNWMTSLFTFLLHRNWRRNYSDFMTLKVNYRSRRTWKIMTTKSPSALRVNILRPWSNAVLHMSRIHFNQLGPYEVRRLSQLSSMDFIWSGLGVLHAWPAVKNVWRPTLFCFKRRFSHEPNQTHNQW